MLHDLPEFFLVCLQAAVSRSKLQPALGSLRCEPLRRLKNVVRLDHRSNLLYLLVSTGLAEIAGESLQLGCEEPRFEKMPGRGSRPPPVEQRVRLCWPGH